METKMISNRIPYAKLLESYIRPESDRPNSTEVLECQNVHVIDFGCDDRQLIIRQIGEACEKYGFFQMTGLLSRKEDLENEHERDDGPVKILERQGSQQKNSVRVAAGVRNTSDAMKSEQEGKSNPAEMLERQGSQRKLTADVLRHNYDKLNTPANKKLPSLSLKVLAESGSTKQTIKQQDSQGSISKKAKPNQISRWIPSNKGPYTNSMHVSYPPTRYNSAPYASACEGCSVQRQFKGLFFHFF